MIYGIGTDICDVRRIRESLDRHGERFAQKILSDADRYHIYEGNTRRVFPRLDAALKKKGQ